MTRADLLLVNDIRNIFANGTKDENPRPKYEDGTPAHTYFVNHIVRTYNLQTEFPICTLRPIAWKTAIREAFAIYQNQSNKISEFERLGCGWWKDWELEDGTIGRSYPYNLESHRPNEMKKSVVKVKRKILNEKLGEIHNEDTICKNNNFDSIDGKLYYTKNNNEFKIISHPYKTQHKNEHKYVDIQFTKTKYITSARIDTLTNINDPYCRERRGIGFVGEYKSNILTDDEIKILLRKWGAMFDRCGNITKKTPTYQNVFVHHDWHNFANFLNDVIYIPQFFLAREDGFKGWDLDKDYYGSNCYSKDTCVFLKRKENSIYARINGCYRISDLNNNVAFYELAITHICEIYNVSERTIRNVINNKKTILDNVKIEFLENNDSYLYRYELSRNQINELIKDIKTNPYGRRHMIDFWNWANIDKKALVECAFLTIWNVRDEYLDMCLIQRSGDMITASGAGGVNEVQYACLQMMIAKATGYKAGKFTHFVANEQIYDRHVGAANKLINRADAHKLNISTSNGHYDYEFEPVKMNFNPKSDNFYDFSIEDFSLENYNPIKPQLKLELGI